MYLLFRWSHSFPVNFCFHAFFFSSHFVECLAPYSLRCCSTTMLVKLDKSINQAWHPQILMERGRVSAKTKQIVNALVPPNLKELLVPEKEFWTASKTLSFLVEGPYFKGEGDADTQLPQVLKDMMDEGIVEEHTLLCRCAKNVVRYVKGYKIKARDKLPFATLYRTHYLSERRLAHNRIELTTVRREIYTFISVIRESLYLLSRRECLHCDWYI